MVEVKHDPENISKMNKAVAGTHAALILPFMILLGIFVTYYKKWVQTHKTAQLVDRDAKREAGVVDYRFKRNNPFLKDHTNVFQYESHNMVLIFCVSMLCLLFGISLVMSLSSMKTSVDPKLSTRKKRDYDAAAMAFHMLSFISMVVFMLWGHAGYRAKDVDVFRWKAISSYSVRLIIALSTLFFIVLGFLVLIFKSIALHTEDLFMETNDTGTLTVVPNETVCTYMADTHCGPKSAYPLPDWECYGIKAKRCVESGGTMFDGLLISQDDMQKSAQKLVEPVKDDTKTKKKLSKGAQAGIGLSIVVLIVLVGSGVYFIKKKKKLEVLTSHAVVRRPLNGRKTSDIPISNNSDNIELFHDNVRRGENFVQEI
jgi:hypothetical protein